MHGVGERHRLLHLPDLHEVAQDVAQVGSRRHRSHLSEAVLHRGKPDGRAIGGVVEVVCLYAVEVAAGARVGVDRDEEIRALVVGPCGACREG